jgi:hypothetical protein
MGDKIFLFLSCPLKPIMSSPIVSFQIKQDTKKLSNPLFFRKSNAPLGLKIHFDPLIELLEWVRNLYNI